ncbi:MAG: YqgE/AlgH family protein [Bacteroidales bacterium]|nr:YqgE/AlgH family protein [Bacteroidales bacterium]
MKTEPDFFKIEHENLMPEKGILLISEPFSNDAYFKRSVVLLTLNDDEGSVGFILNKQVDISLSDLFEEDFDFKGKVSIGGPVSIDRIDFLHTLGELIPNSRHVIDNIYWGGDFNTVLKMLRSKSISEEQIRFFIGYSGWSKGQLDKEIENDFWLVTHPDTQSIMPIDKNYWKTTLKRLGRKYEVWLNIPEDPVLN